MISRSRARSRRLVGIRFTFDNVQHGWCGHRSPIYEWLWNELRANSSFIGWLLKCNKIVIYSVYRVLMEICSEQQRSSSKAAKIAQVSLCKCAAEYFLKIFLWFLMLFTPCSVKISTNCSFKFAVILRHKLIFCTIRLFSQNGIGIYYHFYSSGATFLT